MRKTRFTIVRSRLLSLILQARATGQRAETARFGLFLSVRRGVQATLLCNTGVR
nr:MAG TPA: hypothetical protein [Bacteriophage sp.]